MEIADTNKVSMLARRIPNKTMQFILKTGKSKGRNKLGQSRRKKDYIQIIANPK